MTIKILEVKNYSQCVQCCIQQKNKGNYNPVIKILTYIKTTLIYY